MSNLVGFYSENIGRLFSLIIDEQSIKEVFVDELRQESYLDSQSNLVLNLLPRVFPLTNGKDPGKSC